MKKIILIIVFIFLVILGSPLNAQDSDANIVPEDTNTGIEPHHYTGFPEGSQQDKDKNALIQEDGKRRVEELPVTYMVSLNDSKLRPAYVRYEMGYSAQCIYYVWKGVKLDRKDIPVVDGPFHSLHVTDVTRFPKTRIYHVTPPCYYYQLPGTTQYAVGYFDRDEEIFYEWKQVVLNKKQIPAEAFPDRILKPAPSAQAKEKGWIVLIDPPQ